MPPIKELTALISLIKFTIGNLSTIHGEELEKLMKILNTSTILHRRLLA